MILLALMFACGAFTKFADNLIDQAYKSRWPWLQYLTGLVYGLLAGYLITVSSEFATLIIAITIGVLVAGKIDSKAHQIGIATIFAIVALFGLPAISFFLVALFSGLGFFDELLNDFVDRLREKGKHLNKVLQNIVNARLSLEFGTIAVGIATGNWNYFLAVFSFEELTLNLLLQGSM